MKSTPTPAARGLSALAGALAVATALVCHPAAAQGYPTRAVKLIVPFTPGGSTDISTRHLATEMTPLLGQPVIVENKPGVAGGLGINEVAKSEPDGYTLGISGVGPTILLNLTGEYTQYVTLRDLAFVAHMNNVELALVGKKDLAAANLQQLIAMGKASPGKLSFGNSGLNGPVHLALVLLAQRAGIEVVHVPYKGDGPILQDLLGGQLDVGLISVPGTSAQIKAGTVKALAMLGARRNASFPEVATASEQGLSGYEAYVFQIVVAPVRTPAPIVARLNEVIGKALASPRIKEEYAKLGMVPVGGTPKDAADFVRRETEKWSKVLDSLKGAPK